MSAKKVENYLQKIYKDAPKWMKRNSRYSNCPWLYLFLIIFYNLDLSGHRVS